VYVGTASIIIAGAFWFVERVLAVKKGSEPVVSPRILL
jgi:hypothetical protein